MNRKKSSGQPCKLIYGYMQLLLNFLHDIYKIFSSKINTISCPFANIFLFNKIFCWDQFAKNMQKVIQQIFLGDNNAL